MNLSSKPTVKKLQEKYPTNLDVFDVFEKCCSWREIDVGRGDPGLICRDCIRLLESFVIVYDKLVNILEDGELNQHDLGSQQVMIILHCKI